MEKILIVYYSRTGNTKKVAEAMKEQFNCDIEEIKPVKSYAGPIGWLLAGKEGSQKTHAKINPDPRGTPKNPANYDLVILGTPIWAWNISSPLRAYIAMNKGKFKKIAAFCTMGSEFGQAFKNIEESCGKPLEAQAAFKDKDIASGNFNIKTFLSNKK